MSKVLVVGGAGYVGSATCSWLLDQGHQVWVLDDLSTGRRELVLGHGFVQARAGDRARVLPLLQREKFDVVLHFAARSLVSESVEKPELYRENNIDQTRALLDLMKEAGVHRFVFSSTCAIFGVPSTDSISEDLSKAPVNPYGETKLAVEKMLEERAATDGLRSIALRYFNAAGAEPMGRVGEWHEPESHLIPRILRNVAEGRPADIFGTDYPTPDGTCVRDYIHITDLAAAHEAAMKRLLEGSASGRFEAFNLGSENGYSVREVVDACEKVLGRSIERVEKPRRPGDPPRLVANSTRAKSTLGFRAERGLEEIVRSAWDWETKRSAPVGKKTVFLDRDGTINEDPGYLSDPAQLKLLPGVGESLARLKKAGFTLVVVSNQSGVARGLIKADALPKIHERLQELLAPFGTQIDHFELCFHHPNENCACRKPLPKLILDGARAVGAQVSHSYMVGDKTSDIGAGIRAGCRGTLLVRTGDGTRSDPTGAAFTASSLTEAADWILSDA